MHAHPHPDADPIIALAAAALVAAGWVAGWAAGVAERRTLRRATWWDPLTRLANRSSFYRRAGQVIAAPAGRARAVAVLDVDEFKVVNDRFGHGAGDLALRAVAAELRERVGIGGLVARLYGDEFAVLVPIPAGAALQEVGARLHGADIQVCLDDVSLRLSVSVGLTPVVAATDLAELLGRADAAMFRAKQTGAGVAVYDPVLDDHTTPMPGDRPAVRTRDLDRARLTPAGI